MTESKECVLCTKCQCEVCSYCHFCVCDDVYGWCHSPKQRDWDEVYDFRRENPVDQEEYYDCPGRSV